jgi:hypothetical protein
VHIIALLPEAVLESVASENVARFTAMETPIDNVNKKSTACEQAWQARQSEITTDGRPSSMPRLRRADADSHAAVFKL